MSYPRAVFTSPLAGEVDRGAVGRGVFIGTLATQVPPSPALPRKRGKGYFGYAAALIPFAVANVIGGLTPASAQVDQLTRGKMERVHRGLTIAEENLTLAIRDKDFSRANLVNVLLFNFSSDAHERKLAANPCLEALGGLETVAIAVVFATSPITTKGDPLSMTREELRFSKIMRPTDETLEEWFAEGSATYRTKMSDCEQDIRTVKTARSLPETLLRN